MTQKLQDDAFETLLGRALRMEDAPTGLEQRLLTRRHKSGWFMAIALPFVSPGRIAAGAAVLSLMMGFATGLGNSTVSDDQDLDMAAVLYAANDVGDF